MDRMTVAIRVRALLFARLREQAGAGAVDLELPGEATAAGAYDALRLLHPGLEPDRERVRVARNQAFCAWEDRLEDGDELAFIPPVSGGAGGSAVLIELTDGPLDARRLETSVAHAGAGAICTFTGVVRDTSGGRSVTHLEYEAYGEMAVKQMNAIADEIGERWPEARVAMAHRTGRLEIGEASVVVTISCPHRAEAIAACKWGIDRLKESVPIWKKEFAADGEAWIEGNEARRPPPALRGEAGGSRGPDS
jgi:molybdopterin synthase catalytic subunit